MGINPLGVTYEVNDEDKVVQEINARLRTDLRRLGDFPRVQAMPASSADVPDELLNRLQTAFYTDPLNAAIKAMGLE